MTGVQQLSDLPSGIDVSSVDVIDLDAPEVQPTARAPLWRRVGWRGWAAVCVVAVLLLSVGAAGWQYRERTAYAGTPQWAAVSAYLDAVNTADMARLRLATTGDVVWTGYDPKGAVVLTFTGEEYLLFQRQFFPGFSITVLGQPQVYGDAVAVPLHISGPLAVNYDAFTVFTVRDVGDAPTVDTIMAIPVD